MSGVERRLVRLTKLYPAPRCGTCAWWRADHDAVCDDRGRCTRPETCPACGRTVPIRRRVVLAGVDLGAI